jgi:hypothetical protein
MVPNSAASAWIEAGARGVLQGQRRDVRVGALRVIRVQRRPAGNAVGRRRGWLEPAVDDAEIRRPAAAQRAKLDQDGNQNQKAGKEVEGGFHERKWPGTEGPPGSLHRMQAEHVAFGIEGQGDESVLPDGHLLLLQTAAGGDHPRRLDGAIRATEIGEHAVAARCAARHLHQRPRGAVALLIHGKRQQSTRLATHADKWLANMYSLAYI